MKIAFYERRGFQGTVAVVGLLAAIWAFVGAPKPWQVASEISASTVVLSNTEIILDASAASAKSFGGETKLAAAKRAIDSYVAPLSHEGLALRRAGGACGERRDLTVGFGSDQSEAIREAADAQHPEGSSNIAAAVRAAADDFQEADFKGAETTNRILVFMNVADQCPGNAIRDIHYALLDSGVDAVRIVALRPSHSEVKRLLAFKKGLASVAAVEISTPATKRQLRHVVKREVKAAREAAAVKQKSTSSSQSAREPAEDHSGNSDTGKDGADPSGGAKGSIGGDNKKSEKPAEKKNQKAVEPDCPEGSREEGEGGEGETTEGEATSGGSTEGEPTERSCPEEKPQGEDETTTPSQSGGSTNSSSAEPGSQQSSATGEPSGSAAGP